MLFSVIIPVYDVAPYLRPCVDSVLAQTYGDFELILVDDGSADGSGAICGEYAARDRRVTVLRQENSGVVAARKAGLDRAQGEYVCFVDGDDLVDPRWLETMARCIREYGGPDVVLHDYRQDTGEADQPLYAAPGLYDRVRLEAEIWPYMLWDSRKPFFTQLLPGFLWGKIARRELFLAHYVSDGRITWFEDLCMVYECIRCAQSLAICPEKLYIYRRREGSALLRYNPDIFQNLALCRDYLQAHLVPLDPGAAAQIDAFCADKLVRAVLHELHHGLSPRQAAAHIGRELDRTGLARAIQGRGLPLRIRVFLGLLRRRLYGPAAVLAKARLALAGGEGAGKED